MTKREYYNNFKDWIFPSVVTHGSKLCERDGCKVELSEVTYIKIFCQGKSKTCKTFLFEEGNTNEIQQSVKPKVKQ